MTYENPFLNLERRQSFLACWKNRYPSWGGSGIVGMIVFSENEVWLERNGTPVKKLMAIKLSRFMDEEYQTFQPSEVLLSGDWVEFFCSESTSVGNVEATQIRLLSPNLRDRGHRSQVNPLVRQWMFFLQQVRSIFQAQGFDELSTPTLVPCPGTEPFLEPFKTEFIYGSRKETFFLPTSPEIHLKKCLAMGWDRIFEVKSCFRNGEVSEHHQPEFLMLEWYRAFAGLEDIQRDLKALVVALAPEFRNKKWYVKSMADLFKEFLDFSLRPTTGSEELRSLANRYDIDVRSASDFDELFFFIFLHKIEPQLKNYDCLFLHKYPPSQAALARLTSEGWGDRFEFYIHGVEIANAFNELNDPMVQRQRSQEDLEKKHWYGKTPITLDEEFFDCLQGGMPPSSGVALGLDRLFMVLRGQHDLRDFRLFSL